MSLHMRISSKHRGEVDMAFDNEMFASRLRELRRIKSAAENRDVSQREVSEACGVSEAAYATYERGESTPNLVRAYALADFYNVRLDELCVRDHEKEVG